MMIYKEIIRNRINFKNIRLYKEKSFRANL